jgi:hypothetical protein
MVEAITYGLAKEQKVSDFYIQNSKDFKTPTMVDKLPPKMPLSGGAPETIDEVKTLYLIFIYFKLISRSHLQEITTMVRGV